MASELCNLLNALGLDASQENTNRLNSLMGGK